MIRENYLRSDEAKKWKKGKKEEVPSKSQKISGNLFGAKSN